MDYQSVLNNFNDINELVTKLEVLRLQPKTCEPIRGLLDAMSPTTNKPWLFWP